MINYTEYDQVSLGFSKNNNLTLMTPMSVTTLDFKPLPLPTDSYWAYVVNKYGRLPLRCRKVFECAHWLKVYDDNGVTQPFEGHYIEVYRVGSYGTIIKVQ